MTNEIILSFALRLYTHGTAVEVQDFGAIYDGQAAQRAYLEIINPETSEGRRSKLKDELLEYCQLNTLRVVRLAKFFDGT